MTGLAPHTKKHESSKKGLNRMQTELKAIREELGFSYGEMAQELGVHKATYQGYETGRRATPPHIISSARDSLARDRAFWAGLPLRVDARLALEFPNGIMSGV